MKSLNFFLLGLVILVIHIGCCGVHVVRHGSCGITACDSCCDTGCVDDCHGPGILSRVANRLRSVHCDSGCGETYWDEQINHPRVCDPCGCDGEFVGRSDCGPCPGGLHRIRQLWGFRFIPSNCCECLETASSCSSCSSCATYGSGLSNSSQAIINDAPTVGSHEPIMSSAPGPSTPRSTTRAEPTPAKQPAAAKESPEEIRSTVAPKTNSSTGRVPQTVGTKTATVRPKLVTK